ncbi:MAG: hypothetical protein OMM_04045 [Candidatus Magnetoglobus multicellularis str. Araruama]|uniref:Uncharacterized protein n=1 Tax=Candidatus Magnetoglobus multicellularis str. Araruama TaxID=890399 RepID=A0A1V1P2Y8_9BACT|nr:MAG: hypothetical protein OMM_04045 [Candidatus Magnetoglobus multicellularis str. Araruama]
MRYIGFLEYNHMRTQTSCEEIVAPSKKSGMQNDQIIINAYSDFVDIGKKIIFISRDNEIVRMMTGENNVIPVILEHKPSRRKNFSVTWPQFLICSIFLESCLAKLTLVKEKNDIADIFGVWRGKDVKEWESDQVKLCIRPSSNYAQLVGYINKSITILEKLNL